jgi:hypothetical protein
MISRKFRDCGQGIGEPGKRFYIVEFTGDQQRVNYCGLLCCFMRAGEEVVFTAEFMESFA